MGHYHLIGVNIAVIKGKQILEPENRPLNIGWPLYTVPPNTGSSVLSI